MLFSRFSWWLDLNLFLIIDKYQRKNYDRFINGVDIQLFNLWNFFFKSYRAELQKNVIKEKITGRVHIFWRIVETGPKKAPFFIRCQSTLVKLCFSVPVTSFNFFAFFSKMRQSIDPSGRLVFYEILCSSSSFGRTLLVGKY